MYDEEFMQREELLQPAPEKVPVPVPAVSAGEDAERPLSRADRRARAILLRGRRLRSPSRSSTARQAAPFPMMPQSMRPR